MTLPGNYTIAASYLDPTTRLPRNKLDHRKYPRCLSLHIYLPILLGMSDVMHFLSPFFFFFYFKKKGAKKDLL